MTLVLRRATAVALVLLAGVVGGCDKIKKPLQIQNMSPVVRLTAAPIDTNAVCAPDPARSCYSLTLNWVGYDPDGRVDHFLYAVDPVDNDTTWIVTTDNEKRLVFPSPSLSQRADFLTILRGYHVFVIAAVDNDGAVGPRAHRAFFSFTKAPTVQIDPPPVRSAERLLPPVIRISWHGFDEDGVFTTKPVRYKYLLLGPGNEKSVIPGGIDDILSSNGTLLRTYYAPEFRADHGWVTTSGESTTVQFTNLVPGARYLFTVVAFDEAGAYSPVFGFDKNVVRFRIGFAAAFGPTLTVFNESFFYRYPGGSYNPANEVRIEVPAGQAVRFYWFADPPLGATVTAYRWMLDGDVFDQRQRRDELTDLKRWSTPSSTISATVGPFTGGDHFFYIDAEDNTSLKSLATIHFFVVVPTFDKPLLIVDDTRYRPDQFLGDGSLIAPQGQWPGAAELDTFMYAVGGVPWENYPAGTTSTEGILHGYEYDTLGTRRGVTDSGTPLATLGGYRHVIWLIDFATATFGNPGNVPNDPISSLRYMSGLGHLNSLGAYVRMGGEAWLVGGGGQYATLIPYNDNANDGGGGSWVWNHSNQKRELDAGRFMYDVPKWQSIVRDRSAVTMAETNNIVRSLGRLRNNPGVYAGLPASFNMRNTTTDPLPPLRTNSLYYLTTYACEFIGAIPPQDAANVVMETVIGSSNDFKIDSFNDFLPGPVKARWPSSDTLNTKVDTDTVTAQGTRAAGRALRIRTQGGGSSTGDFVTFDFGTNPRDWSGLSTVKLQIMQDQPTSLVRWRVRAIDTRGGSASAPINPSSTGGSFVDAQVKQAEFTTDASSPVQPDFVRIQKVALVLERGDAAATTQFDNLEVTTLPEGAVLDTLLAAQLSFAADPPINATMTVYHGHDFQKPFIFTGFAPWGFRRSECKELFDFVLQKMWGLYPSSTVAGSRPAMFAPAHQRTTPLPRTGPGLRDGTSSRGAAAGGRGLRQVSSPGVPSRPTGRP